MKKIEESAEFQTFWSIWKPISRHTDGRGLAREAFRKQVLMGACPDDIVDGARWYARNLSEREKPYVPLSATWIHRETYDGLCDKEREFKDRIESSQAQQNIVPIRVKAELPANHFSRQWEQRNKEQAS
jgi:hypothetical protein